MHYDVIVANLNNTFNETVDATTFGCSLLKYVNFHPKTLWHNQQNMLIASTIHLLHTAFDA